MKKRKLYRQGDVLIEEIEDTQDKVMTPMTPAHDLIVAEGEATGHHHVVRGPDLLAALGGPEIVFRTGSLPARIEHEEHAPIELPARRTFRVVRQKEWIRGVVSD